MGMAEPTRPSHSGIGLGTEVTVHESTAVLCEAVATEVVRGLADALSRRPSASLVLTGGRAGTAVLAAIREHAASRTVDWSRVDFYWGDERFVPADHPDRNESQARHALLDHIPVDPARIHPMPASDGVHGNDLVAAAAAYRELVRATGQEGFDVCLLGVGEDGHVASLFPGLPAMSERDLPVVAVTDSPKPPPSRITLTLPVIRRCDEVFLLATGSAKASAVATALGANADNLPAASVSGASRTVWFLDTAAASEL